MQLALLAIKTFELYGDKCSSIQGLRVYICLTGYYLTLKPLKVTCILFLVTISPLSQTLRKQEISEWLSTGAGTGFNNFSLCAA